MRRHPFAAVNLIREAAALYEVTPESRILQTASVGFDASVLEIFLALAHGASLCLVREEERLTPAVLADRLIGLIVEALEERAAAQTMTANAADKVSPAPTKLTSKRSNFSPVMAPWAEASTLSRN